MKTLVPGENKVTRYLSYILMSKLSGNCVTNYDISITNSAFAITITVTITRQTN